MKEFMRITKKFKSRYGYKLRKRYAEVMAQRFKEVRCPYCQRKVRMKRISVGIWSCPKCKVTFTAKAYTPVVGGR